MKRKLQIIISASAASVFALTAFAQDTPSTKSETPEYSRGRMPHARQANRLHGAAKASEIIGMTVNNYQNEKLGKVEDLAVDVESGRVVQIILSIGGFIGIGDTLTAVPPGALHHDVAQKVLHLDADKEKLKAAPKFEMSRWAECCDSEHLSQVYRHYGEEPAFKFIHKGDATLDGLRNPDGQVNKDGQRNTDEQRRRDAQRNTEGNWDKDHLSSHEQFMIPISRLSKLQRASKLMGTSVKNLQNDKIGQVDNLLIDMASGRVVAVIVSSGGFLGLGDELSAIPPTALRFNAERDTLQLDATKEMLGSAPHFRANQWPDFTQPTYAHGVYHAYKVEPYFTTNMTTQPNNSARNVRDRGDRTLTPFDQGSSKADVDTTAKIRKEIIAGKNMSVSARNVKIITNQGRVTLRGPVNTADEKRIIGEIAIGVALVENVDNQLEVK